MENKPCASAPRSEQKQAEKATGPFQGKRVRSSRRRASGVPPPDTIDSNETPTLESSLKFRGGDGAIRGGTVQGGGCL